MSALSGIIGFLLLVITGVFDNLPNRDNFLKKRPKVKWITYLLSVFLLMFSGYSQFIHPVLEVKSELIVTPNEYSLHAGRDEVFVMKLTNHKKLPLYDIHILFSIVSGDLTTKEVKIRPLNEPKIKSFNGDQKSGLKMAFDLIMLQLIPKDSKTNEPTMVEMIINNINPGETKDYEISLIGWDIKSDSKIELSIKQSSDKPNPILSGKGLKLKK
jgi:hypothetical protein